MKKPITIIIITLVIVLGIILFGLPQQTADQPTEVSKSQPQQLPPPPPIVPHEWNAGQKAILSSLSLSALPGLPDDPSNVVAEDPRAVVLGHRLFFDARLSSNGQVSCASCHKPELKFTDGLPRAKGVGVTPRKTMTIIGTAYSPWLFWDGRKDSQWSQALGPTESPVEHGGNRTMYAHTIHSDAWYRDRYEALFGELPDLDDGNRFPPSAGPVDDPAASEAWQAMSGEDRESINKVFVNMGKAIAAYERKIMPGESRFDSYADAVEAGDKDRMKSTFTESEARGLNIFIGKGQCINCHNGPLFSNHSFHNTGVPPALDLPPDFGRIEGVMQVRDDPFNCLGKYSDASEEECDHLRFARTDGIEIVAAFKTPTLRNVSDTAPYMHSGQIATLAEVIDHYSQAPLAVRGHSELAPLDLTGNEKRDLEAFLGTLSSPLATPEDLLVSPFPEPDTDPQATTSEEAGTEGEG